MNDTPVSALDRDLYAPWAWCPLSLPRKANRKSLDISASLRRLPRRAYKQKLVGSTPTRGSVFRQVKTKRCSSCKRRKATSLFNARGLGWQSKCRRCNSLYGKKHYAANPAYYAAKSKARKVELRAFVESLKLGKDCTDCGRSFPPCAMDFDHLDGSTKVGTISYVSRRLLWPKERILEEVEKCELVCAKCHRIRTHARAQGKASVKSQKLG